MFINKNAFCFALVGQEEIFLKFLPEVLGLPFGKNGRVQTVIVDKKALIWVGLGK